MNFTPRIFALALAATLVAGAASAAPKDLVSRIDSALQAARSTRPASMPSSELVSSPLTSRIGVDVSFKARPGVWTPMQIKGDRLQAATADSVATARTFLRANRGLLRLQDPDRELALTATADDELGFRHLRFEQRWRGLAVWPAQVVLHLDEAGSVYLLDGAYVPTPRLQAEPVVDAAAAAARASRLVPGARSVSTPELFVFAPGSRPSRLAWRMQVEVSAESRWLVVIDAVSGAKLLAYDQVLHAAATGAGRDLDGVTRNLNLWRSGADYYLVDTSKPMFDRGSAPPLRATTRGAILLYDVQNGDDPALAVPVRSRNAASWAPADAVSAAYALSATYDYFLQVHGRDSLDGHGGNLYAYVRFDRGLQNALWNGEAMLFGDARPYAGAFDIVAHELTHGVTQNTAGLLYQDQPGALNEAFSDIFGQAVEARLEGAADWRLGDGLGSPLRDMRNPGSLFILDRPFPSRMSEMIAPGDPFLDRLSGRDNGGVHINNSIVNRAFYLLADGLPGAVGMTDAERIFFRALTLHLTSNAQFLDARLACVQSAEELFGAGSAQALKTAEAFDRVEIFDSSHTPTPPDGLHGPDSALAVSFSLSGGGFVLQRREEALSDPGKGRRLGSFLAGVDRPAVSGDGTLAFFLNAAGDACFIRTDGNRAPSCLGLPGKIHAVAMSQDVTRFALVPTGTQNHIEIVDLPSRRAIGYTLPAPALRAGSMDFTMSGGHLVYEALTSVTLPDGTRAGAWSLYALDLTTGQPLVMVPPVAGLDLANPSPSRAADGFLAFEGEDAETGAAVVFTLDLDRAEVKAAAMVEAGPAVPGYTADDGALVFSGPSEAPTPTTRALYWQDLAGDRLTAVGDPVMWLDNATHGAVYRRGKPQPVKLTTVAAPGAGYAAYFEPADLERIVAALKEWGRRLREGKP